MFHNAPEYYALYAGEPALPPRYCAPRLDHGYEVEAVRRRIALRAGLCVEDGQRPGRLRGYIDLVGETCVMGWAQTVDAPEAQVCLDIFAGEQLVGQVLANRYRADLDRAGMGSGRHGFAFFPPKGFNLCTTTISVRRSLDGVALLLSERAERSRRSMPA
jgi:hypothetical protein